MSRSALVAARTCPRVCFDTRPGPALYHWLNIHDQRVSASCAWSGPVSSRRRMPRSKATADLCIRGIGMGLTFCVASLPKGIWRCSSGSQELHSGSSAHPSRPACAVQCSSSPWVAMRRSRHDQRVCDEEASHAVGASSRAACVRWKFACLFVAYTKARDPGELLSLRRHHQ
jgi:hypothetical protein